LKVPIKHFCHSEPNHHYSYGANVLIFVQIKGNHVLKAMPFFLVQINHGFTGMNHKCNLNSHIREPSENHSIRIPMIRVTASIILFADVAARTEKSPLNVCPPDRCPKLAIKRIADFVQQDYDKSCL
jgi:hypothetical protein